MMARGILVLFVLISPCLGKYVLLYSEGWEQTILILCIAPQRDESSAKSYCISNNNSNSHDARKYAKQYIKVEDWYYSFSTLQICYRHVEDVHEV